MLFPNARPWSALTGVCLPLFACAVSPGSAGASPLVMEPGVTARGEQPASWSADWKASPAELRETARGLSSRIYGSRQSGLNHPLRFETGFDTDKTFAFHVHSVSRNGASLDVRLDGEFFHRRFWFGGLETHQERTLFYLTVPAGTRHVELFVPNPQGVVVIDRYLLADSPADLPGREAAVRLERMEDPALVGKDSGYRGIWFTLGQFSEFGDKYSGGLGTYTANHIPLAIYAEEVDKTFFVYGGTVRDQQHLLVMASYYDHARHRVPRPTIVHDKEGVNDPHDNPSIAMDGDGHIWVFISGRGRSRPGFKYRSVEPYSVEEFELIAEQELTYPQPWWHDDKGFIHLFTKYTRGRELYFETSSDGREWSEDVKLAGIRGHYQVSSQLGGKIGTFFNRHPDGSVDRRTDLYFMQTTDWGQTWTTVDGRPLELPLEEEDNPARVINYSERGRLQYTVDLNWDHDGNPILLYVTSGGHQPGPDNEPRFWEIAHWNGTEWRNRVVCRSDHNYDLGSLHVLEDRWIIIGPTGTGPQPWGTGGEIEIWESRDQGERWTKIRQVTVNSPRNHKYVRRPVNARDPFFAFWADGNPDEPSISKLYFGEKSGQRYWELPYDMEGDFATPREISIRHNGGEGTPLR